MNGLHRHASALHAVSWPAVEARPAPVAAAAAALLLLWVAARPRRLLNLPPALRSRRTGRALRYGDAPGQRMDLFQPGDGDLSGPGAPPLVVYLHGGPAGRRRGDDRFVGEALARRGVAVAILDARPGVARVEEDVARALALALGEAPTWGCDPRRVFAMGAGDAAPAVAAVALDPRWLATVGRQPAALAGWVALDPPPGVAPPGPASGAASPGPAPGAGGPPGFLGQVGRANAASPGDSLAEAARAAGTGLSTRRYEGVRPRGLVTAFAWPFRRRAPVCDDVASFIRDTPQAPAPAPTMPAAGPGAPAA